MARRPRKGYEQLAEEELALRQIERQERKAEATLQRRKEERQIATGTASIDVIRRHLGPHFWDR
jgi:hypothetical protein